MDYWSRSNWSGSKSVLRRAVKNDIDPIFPLI